MDVLSCRETDFTVFWGSADARMLCGFSLCGTRGTGGKIKTSSVLVVYIVTKLKKRKYTGLGNLNLSGVEPCTQLGTGSAPAVKQNIFSFRLCLLGALIMPYNARLRFHSVLSTLLQELHNNLKYLCHMFPSLLCDFSIHTASPKWESVSIQALEGGRRTVVAQS